MHEGLPWIGQFGTVEKQVSCHLHIISTGTKVFIIKQSVLQLVT